MIIQTGMRTDIPAFYKEEGKNGMIYTEMGHISG
jgi:hypothetical protein